MTSIISNIIDVMCEKTEANRYAHDGFCDKLPESFQHDSICKCHRTSFKGK